MDNGFCAFILLLLIGCFLVAAPLAEEADQKAEQAIQSVDWQTIQSYVDAEFEIIE